MVVLRQLTVVLPILGALVGAPTALADVLTGTGADRVGDVRSVDRARVSATSRDIAAVRSSLDTTAGTWTVTVEFVRAPRFVDVAQLHAALYEQRGGRCPRYDNAALIATLHGRSSRASRQQHWVVLTPGQGNVYDDDAHKVTSADLRHVTLTASSDRLLGRAGFCVDATLSHFGVIDRINIPVRLERL